MGYAGSTERPGERHAAEVDATFAFESVVGVEVGARSKLGADFQALSLYAGILATNFEDPIRVVARAGLGLAQVEWLGPDAIGGGASPLVELGLRVQLSGRRYESRPGYFYGPGRYYAAQGLFLEVAAGVEYTVRVDRPGEGFAFVTAGLSYAFGAPAPDDDALDAP